MVFAQKYIAQLTVPKGEQKAHIQRYMTDLVYIFMIQNLDVFMMQYNFVKGNRDALKNSTNSFLFTKVYCAINYAIGEQKAHIQRYMVDLYLKFEHDNARKCIYWKTLKSTEVMFGGRAG